MTERIVHHPDCTEAHIADSRLGCRLRIPPDCEEGDTITIEQYRAWEAERQGLK